MAAPLIDRVHTVNPAARLCAYGLYAPLNAQWLRERGVTQILGPESEEELVEFVNAQRPTPNFQSPKPEARSLPTLEFIQPDRSSLPPLRRYASLRMTDGSQRTIGSTDSTRGCKHLCRHCPIVPVYQGRFRVVPIEVVLDDIRTQVLAGAQHISFGDPDFFNGPTHARRLVEAVSREFPGLSYDVTIKIEHLLKHADMIPLLRRTGCLFVTSAVESIDDDVLEKLRKGHTRRAVVRAVAMCRDAGLILAPTFVPFTPWTAVKGYIELLEAIDQLDIVAQVAPVQLGIRLLITAQSRLLELPDIQQHVTEFDPATFTWPWRHRDARVDALQAGVMRIVVEGAGRSREDVFSTIVAFARDRAGMPTGAPRGRTGPPVPYVSEPWYCCAEPRENC